MPKSKRASAAPKSSMKGVTAAAADGTDEFDSAPAADPVPQNTFTAASGRFFATARSNYPEAEDFAEEFTCDVVGAAEGDLLEVLAIHEDWAYGRRFKPRQDLTLEGVFCLEWVCGVKLVFEAGKRKPVEIDIRSEEYGFKGASANDAVGKLQTKRYRKRIEDAREIWNRLEAKAAAASVIGEREAAAAKLAEQLEKDDAEEQTRRKKEEERREAILAEVKRRKAEAEHTKKQAAVEAERIRSAEEGRKRRLQREAEEARSRAALEEQARLKAEHAETQRLEHEANEKRLVVETEARMAEEESARRLEVAEAEARRVAEVTERAEELATEHAEELATERAEELARRQGILLATPRTGCDRQSTTEDSCEGVDQDSDSSNPKRFTGSRKNNTAFKLSRKLRRPSSELEAVTDEWHKVQAEMANKCSDLDTLEEKVKSLLQSQGSGDPPQFRPPPGLELMSEAERNVVEVNVLKQRVFQAMLKTKRAAGLERRTSNLLKKKVFQAMFSAKRSVSPTTDKEAELQNLQLKNLMKRAFTGLRASKRTSDGHLTPRGSKSEDSPSDLSPEGSNQEDLEMLAEQVVEKLQAKAESIKAQIRAGFLRAHRTGELLELREELDELADSVSEMGAKLSPSPGLPEKPHQDGQGPSRSLSSRRWAEYTSGSESDGGVMGRSPLHPSGDCSDSDLEYKRASID